MAKIVAIPAECWPVPDPQPKTLYLKVEGWRERAACRGIDPRVFVPDRDSNVKMPEIVKTECPTCPVRETCLTFGQMSRLNGWWGGVLLRYGVPYAPPKRQPGPRTLMEPPSFVRRKLTAAQVPELRDRNRKGATAAQLADEYGVHARYMARVIKGEVKLRRRGVAVLSDADIAEIRRRFELGGVLVRELADEFGVGEQTISKLVSLGVGTGYRNASKTHCPKGHEYTAENTYVKPSTGHRTCRTCRLELQRAKR